MWEKKIWWCLKSSNFGAFYPIQHAWLRYDPWQYSSIFLSQLGSNKKLHIGAILSRTKKNEVESVEICSHKVDNWLSLDWLSIDGKISLLWDWRREKSSTFLPLSKHMLYCFVLFWAAAWEKNIHTLIETIYTKFFSWKHLRLRSDMCREPSDYQIIKSSVGFLFFIFLRNSQGKKASHNMADIKTFVWICSGNLFSYHIMLAYSYTSLANNQIAFYSEKPIEVGMLVFLMWWLLPDFAYTWQYLHQQRIAWREVNKYKHLIACLISDRHGGGAASRTQEKPAFTKKYLHHQSCENKY